MPVAPPRGILDDGGRGTDCGRICGAVSRALIGPVGPALERGTFPAPMPDRPPMDPAALGGRGTERAPIPVGGLIPVPAFGEPAVPRSGIRAPVIGLRVSGLRAPFCAGCPKPRFAI